MESDSVFVPPGKSVRFSAALVLLWAGAAYARAETPLRETIDRRLSEAWQKNGATPAEPADEATFLRRVYLDLGGIIPTHEVARAFLDDADPQKRARLIDRLLEDPRYAQHQADVWDMVLFGRNPPGYNADKRAGFQRWLREAFAANEPYDKIVVALLRGEGNTAEQGAPMYLAQYDRHPEDAAVAVTQTILGVQLQCARCHDHPYEAWTQLDFYGTAAFFARLQNVKVGKADDLDKIYVGEMNTGDVKFTGSVTEDAPGKEGKPVGPKFLHGDTLDEPDLSEEFKTVRRLDDGKVPPAPKFSRKDKFAEWVVSPQNKYLARAAVNRIWSQLMGRGLVHPVDNMSESNSPSHPELLAEISEAFVAHRYDVKWLIREILNTRAYQLGAGGETTEAMPVWFERARTRPLSAEELLESWRVATGYDEALRQKGKEEKGRLYGVTWDYVRRFFGEPVTGTGDFQGGLAEHLYLNNGQLDQLITSDKGSLAEALDNKDVGSDDRVERLFLCVLSRRPSDQERARFIEYLSNEMDQRQRIKEAIWTLLTCSEFRFNH